jgi:hypothetical protein
MTELEKMIAYVNEQKREADSRARMMMVSPKVKGKQVCCGEQLFKFSEELLLSNESNFTEGRSFVYDWKREREKNLPVFI